MTRTIYMQAGPDDYLQLFDFIENLGLVLLPSHLDQLTVDGRHPAELSPAAKWQGVLLSPLPISELHPYGEDDPPVQISSAIDPMLDFIRPYYDPEHHVLVQGYIRWHGKGRGVGPTNDQEIGSVIQPYFGKLERWIRKHWKKRDDICNLWWLGPQAERMIDYEGVKPQSLPPGLKIQKVWRDPETDQSYIIDEVDPETGDW